jgi:hypothetical protein
MVLSSYAESLSPSSYYQPRWYVSLLRHLKRLPLGSVNRESSYSLSLLIIQFRIKTTLSGRLVDASRDGSNPCQASRAFHVCNTYITTLTQAAQVYQAR